MFGIRKDEITRTDKWGESLSTVSTASGTSSRDLKTLDNSTSITNLSKDEIAIKRRVLNVGRTIDYMSAMSMNREERRRLAKMNKVGKIPGSMKPYLKPKIFD